MGKTVGYYAKPSEQIVHHLCHCRFMKLCRELEAVLSTVASADSHVDTQIHTYEISSRHDQTHNGKGTQTWVIVSWCGVTPFKAEVYWTDFVQQTFEVHDMSYGGGKGVRRRGWGRWPQGEICTAETSRYQNIYAWDMTGVEAPTVHERNIFDHSFQHSWWSWYKIRSLLWPSRDTGPL